MKKEKNIFKYNDARLFKTFWKAMRIFGIVVLVAIALIWWGTKNYLAMLMPLICYAVVLISLGLLFWIMRKVPYITTDFDGMKLEACVKNPAQVDVKGAHRNLYLVIDGNYGMSDFVFDNTRLFSPKIKLDYEEILNHIHSIKFSERVDMIYDYVGCDIKGHRIVALYHKYKHILILLADGKVLKRKMFGIFN